MANVIPRKARLIDATWVGDSHYGPKHMVCYKEDDGWHGLDDDGKWWKVFTSHLRKSELYQIKVLETI